MGGTPVILGNTLYAVTPDDRYVFAIDTANGNLEWQYELDLTEFGTGGRNYYSISIPAVSADIVVFQFRASHSSYTGPPVAIEPGESAPELGETMTRTNSVAKRVLSFKTLLLSYYIACNVMSDSKNTEAIYLPLSI